MFELMALTGVLKPLKSAVELWSANVFLAKFSLKKQTKKIIEIIKKIFFPFFEIFMFLNYKPWKSEQKKRIIKKLKIFMKAFIAVE